jgi:uncharacterized membrane protein YfcA
MRSGCSHDQRLATALVTSLLLFVAALVGGALNAVAGGGSFIALPALISVGVSPVVANATTTCAMWPASLSSALAYRREIAPARRWLLPLGSASLVGGMAGGWLLVNTSDELFLRLLPWLMLSAAVVFTFGGRVSGRMLASAGARDALRTTHTVVGTPAWIVLFQLIVAIYGGYFGGGMGIIMLAALALVRLGDMHAMNGIKALLAVTINGVALAEFIATGTVAWRYGLPMAAGGIVGGFGGAAIARTIHPGRIRSLVIVIASVMTAYFFTR